VVPSGAVKKRSRADPYLARDMSAAQRRAWAWERRGLVAYHEAAHAVAARALGIEVDRVVLRARSYSYVKQRERAMDRVPTDAPLRACLDAVKRDVRTALAGPHGEARADRILRRRRWFPEPGSRRRGHWGMSHRDFEYGARGDRRAVERYVRWIARALIPIIRERLDAETRALVNRHWPEIRRVARALLERGTLTGREVDALIAGRSVGKIRPRPAKRKRSTRA
jgi:hypothetical protein